MKKILLYGGTFDPVHYGHISLVKNAIKKLNPQKVLIIPSFIPPHKKQGNTPVQLRLEMCKEFLKISNLIEICDIEILRQGTSYTIDTVLQLKKQYADYQFYFAVGCDMLLYFDKWKQYKQLLKEVILFYQPREIDNSQEILEYITFLQNEGGQVITGEKEIVVVSSSEIREMVAGGKAIDKLVPQKVQQIIDSNNLYKGK